MYLQSTAAKLPNSEAIASNMTNIAQIEFHQSWLASIFYSERFSHNKREQNWNWHTSATSINHVPVIPLFTGMFAFIPETEGPEGEGGTNYEDEKDGHE